MVELIPVRTWHPNPDVLNPNGAVGSVFETLSQSDFAHYMGIVKIATATTPVMEIY